MVVLGVLVRPFSTVDWSGAPVADRFVASTMAVDVCPCRCFRIRRPNDNMPSDQEETSWRPPMPGPTIRRAHCGFCESPDNASMR